MKNVFIILVLLSASFALKAQTFPTIGQNPSWKVGVWSFWFSSCEALNWKYGTSVTICGTPYIEVVECNYANVNCVIKGYIRTEQQKVFVRKTTSCTEQEKIMYDFSKSPGSGYHMGYNIGTYDSTAVEVTATQTVNYYGINRLTQQTTYTVDPPANNYTSTMQAIVGIGSDIHPFFPLTCFGDFCETELQLLEYREGSTVLYSKTPAFPTNCTSWVGIKEQRKNVEVSLYPNPTSAIVTIKASPEINDLKLTDSWGRILAEQKIHDNGFEVDMSGFSSGIYFIEFYNDRHLKLVTEKIIRE